MDSLFFDLRVIRTADGGGILGFTLSPASPAWPGAPAPFSFRLSLRRPNGEFIADLSARSNQQMEWENSCATIVGPVEFTASDPRVILREFKPTDDED